MIQFILGLLVGAYIVIGFVNGLVYAFNQGMFGTSDRIDFFIRVMAWPFYWGK